MITLPIRALKNKVIANMSVKLDLLMSTRKYSGIPLTNESKFSPYCPNLVQK